MQIVYQTRVLTRTESTFVPQFDRSKAMLWGRRTNGFTLWLDGFGVLDKRFQLDYLYRSESRGHGTYANGSLSASSGFPMAPIRCARDHLNQGLHT
jgi:hypothetical protein